MTDAHAALRNVVAQLQADASRYKAFGVWWWPIKALLKGAGYGRDQLYMLGDYVDREQAALVPEGGLAATMAAAFEAFGENIRYPHPGGEVETPDGELVVVLDADAGF